MGTVYEAIQPDLSRRVALKVLSPSLANDPEFVARFKREAKATALLDHPNVVRIHDIGQYEDSHYYAMEFVRGYSIQDMLDRKDQLDINESCEIICQSAMGLEHAWDKGIIHRDVKPDNIMITHQGEVKITDLGLAKQVSGADNLTRTDATMGTPLYMSPEQINRPSEMDFRSDIYSLGVTFYQMVTGYTPFEGEGNLEVVGKILTEDAEPVRKLNPDVPKEVAKVIEKMMHKDPKKRYQDSGLLIDDLAGLVLGEKEAITTSLISMATSLSGSGSRSVSAAGYKTGNLRNIIFAALSVVMLCIIVGVIVNRNKPKPVIPLDEDVLMASPNVTPAESTSKPPTVSESTTDNTTLLLKSGFGGNTRVIKKNIFGIFSYWVEGSEETGANSQKFKEKFGPNNFIAGPNKIAKLTEFEIKNTTGRDGNMTRVLYQGLLQQSEILVEKDKSSNRRYRSSENAFEFSIKPDTKQSYSRYWMKIQKDFKTIAKDGAHRNIMVWSNKTDAWTINLIVTKEKSLYWIFKYVTDSGQNTILFEKNTDVPVPIGEWFLLEVFWRQSKTDQGKIQVAVNKNILFNIKGRNIAKENMNSWKIFSLKYQNLQHGPAWQYIDDLEIHSDIPANSVLFNLR